MNLTHDQKMKEMGRVATALLQLNLKDPKKFNSELILRNLFIKFEELELVEKEDE